MTTRVYDDNSPIFGKILGYFARQSEEYVPAPGIGVPPRPQDLQAMINAAFWASLHRVEDYPVRLSLAYLSKDQSESPFVFAKSLSLEPSELAKAAPAVERSNIHLAVWPDEQVARVWGFSRTVPLEGFVLEVSAPGVLVIKHRREGPHDKFVNVAVLAGEQVKFMLDSRGESVVCEDVLHPVFARYGKRLGAGLLDPSSAFVRLAISMREHRRGGTILVVPAELEEWRESVVEPLSYAAVSSYAELRHLEVDGEAQRVRARRRNMLSRAIDAIAGLTAVDGATLMTDSLEIVGFGVKIQRRKGRQTVESVVVSEPIEGNRPSREHVSALGGTRHLSAAQFVQDQPGAVALVASQDGRFTIFSWSSRESLVHAQRVDSLLL